MSSIYATDALNRIIGLQEHAGISLPTATIAALDNPREIAQKLGEQNFGGNFRVTERIGKFQLDGCDILVSAGLTNAAPKTSAHISTNNLVQVNKSQQAIVQQLLFPACPELVEWVA